MISADAIKWLENLKKDIGNPAYQSLWHYEQALTEIIDLLADRKTENNSEKPNNCEKPQTNRIADKKPTPIRDFMVNGKVNYELQAEQQTKRPWGMYIIEHPMYE